MFLSERESQNFLKAYSLELSILVAAILVSSTMFATFGSLSASNQAVLAQLRAAPTTGAAVAQQVAPSGNQAPQLPPAQPIQVDTSNRAVRGDPNAPVTIVEFSDFQCPFCKRAYPTVEQLLSEYNGRVKLVFMHLPLSFHEYAQKAAEAFECAKDQGREWEFHDKIFEGDNSNIPVSVLKQYAVELGMDAEQFNQCLDSGEKASIVAQDVAQLESKQLEFAAWGIDGVGTPTFLVNGRPVVGAQPYAAFKTAVDAALNA